MRTFLLLRLLIKTEQSNIGGSTKKQRKLMSNMSSIFRFTILIVALAYLSILFYQGGVTLTQTAMDLGNPRVVLELLIPSFCLFFTITGFFYIMTVLYHSQNIEYLLSLPFTSAQVLRARLIHVQFYMHFTVWPIIIPPLLAYGIHSGQTYTYYIALAVISLTLPILLSSFISIILMLIMRFTSFARNKERFRTISSIVVMVVCILPWVYFSVKKEQVISDLLQNSLGSSVFQKINIVFFGSEYALNWLSHSDSPRVWLDILIYLVMCGIWVFVAVCVAKRCYFKGAMAGHGIPRKRRVLTEQETNQMLRRSGAFKALWVKEWRVLYRTPVFFINNLISNFFIVVMFLVGMYMAFIKSESGTLHHIRFALGEADLIQYVGFIPFFAALGLGFFMGGFSGIAASSLSREGQQAYIMKTFPYKFKSQMLVKLLVAFIGSFVSLGLMLIILIFVIQPPFWLWAPFVLVSTLCVLIINILGVVLDMVWPKLNWTNETQAVKSNFNVFLQMIASFVLIGLSVLFLLGGKLIGLDGYWLGFLLSMVFLLILVSLMTVFFNLSSRRVEKKIIG